jgi:hypothetical protein
MAFTETFRCDVCNKTKSEESEDWWLAWTETISPLPGEAEQPVIKVTPWHPFLAHSAEVRHLCGARCVHTLTDRWMTAEG